MSLWLQKSASIQERTSPLKFAPLAEKSEQGSISNLSTKVGAAVGAAVGVTAAATWSAATAPRRMAPLPGAGAGLRKPLGD